MKTYSSVPKNETYIENTCRICQSSRSTEFLKSEEYCFVRCSSCHFIYQNPAPVFSDLRKRYTQGYFEYELENEKNFFSLMKLGLKDINLEVIPADLFENNNFLDIGCATGMLCAYIKEQGWNVKGVDLCKESAVYGKQNRGVDIFAGTLAEAGFPDSYFSFIHFSHLIEHVPDPKALLIEVRRILTDKGIAVITTPNINGFQARLFREKWRSAIADHLYLFSKPTLSRLLKDTGFSIDKIVTWGGLAQGAGPVLLKRILDYSAKKFGFGDVMLFLVRKNSVTEVGNPCRTNHR
ncbi:MAG: class I SAM-dependent methyltransferase [Spirochaetales bacterium]|nr:class I SAM-dependent methyltransferase [Spirochaetales bacterium]